MTRGVKAMSKYTTEVRYICETYAGLSESSGYSNVDDILTKAAPKVFDFEFPIFDEDYRLGLEKKILLNYYTREICEEAVGLWKLRLQSTMNVIMPYYNKLYESELLKFNPLYDVEYTKTGENSGTVNDTTKTQNNGRKVSDTELWNIYSDTPQGGLNGVKNDKYITNATHVSSTGSETNNDTTDSTGNSKTTGEYVEKIVGKMGSGSYATMIKEFRSTFLNIDKQVIDELAGLFFGLW
jgi:hypothetical protein